MRCPILNGGILGLVVLLAGIYYFKKIKQTLMEKLPTKVFETEAQVRA